MDAYIYISCVESRNMTEHPDDEIEMYFSDDDLFSERKTDSVEKNVCSKVYCIIELFQSQLAGLFTYFPFINTFF
jgi:hypothetical protein